MADNQEKPADKGGFDDALAGNFAPDAQLVILGRICRCLEEKANKAIEEVRVVKQLIQKLKDDQFNNDRTRRWAAEKDAQRNPPSPPH
jgi:hypothetical protein